MRKSGIITGPALKSASSTVLVCGRSGQRAKASQDLRGDRGKFSCQNAVLL